QVPFHRLVPRPSQRRRSEDFPLERGEARRSGACRLEAVRSSRARKNRYWWMGSLSCLRQPAAPTPRTRDREISEVAGVAGAPVAEARARRRSRASTRARSLERTTRSTEHGLASELCEQARAGAKSRARGRRRDNAARACGARDRKAPRGNR